jgi:hypothetical protein
MSTIGNGDRHDRLDCHGRQTKPIIGKRQGYTLLIDMRAAIV